MFARLRGLSKDLKEFSDFFNTKRAIIVPHIPRYRFPSLGTSLEHHLLRRLS